MPELLKLIPEFAHFKDFKDIRDHCNTPYIIGGAFSRFYLYTYKNGNEQLLKRMSDFLEEMAKSKDVGIQKLILVDYFFWMNIDSKADYYTGVEKTFGEYTNQVLQYVKRSWDKFKNVVSELLKRIPELAQFEDFKCDEGNQDNQYVVFGVLRNFYIESFQQCQKELVKRMSDFLEEIAQSKYTKMQELVAYGFLENLDRNADYYEGIVKTFGEHTRRQLRDVDKFWSNYEETKRREIYELWKKGASISSLEQKFGVKKESIHRILKQAEDGDFRTSL